MSSELDEQKRRDMCALECRAYRAVMEFRCILPENERFVFKETLKYSAFPVPGKDARTQTMV
jgi:hypothetical protein